MNKEVLDAIRRLGSIGGKKAARNMTKEERAARSKKAGKASAAARAAKAKAKVRRRKEGK